MAKIAVFDISRKQVSERELVDEVFNTDVKEYLLARYGPLPVGGPSSGHRQGKRP